MQVSHRERIYKVLLHCEKLAELLKADEIILITSILCNVDFRKRLPRKNVESGKKKLHQTLNQMTDEQMYEILEMFHRKKSMKQKVDHDKIIEKAIP